MKEESSLTPKIKTKIQSEPSFSFKSAEKVEKLVLLRQKYLAAVLDCDHFWLAAVLDRDQIEQAAVRD